MTEVLGLGGCVDTQTHLEGGGLTTFPGDVLLVLSDNEIWPWDLEGASVVVGFVTFVPRTYDWSATTSEEL